ncbi:MAG: hypothetical protein K2Q22_04240 [Cytophagales bacterium]|nr:hypothetical protein [Cytophagales bacterium]
MYNSIELRRLKMIRRFLILFIVCLIFSGLTAFPIEWQLRQVHDLIIKLEFENELTKWILTAYNAVRETNSKYPFLAYGTDWLAFAHLVIAILFIGILRDPIRNIWVIKFGMIACVAIFPTTFIAGSIRGIPFFWQIIDCSFGVFGGLLLWVIYEKCKQLENGISKK